jgi:hypothetical protein
MAGSTKKSDILRRLRREGRAVLRFTPWLLLSLLLVLVLWQADTAALAGLFQSPPTDTPVVPATNTPAATPTLLPTATATQAITQTATPLPSDTPAIVPSATPAVTPTLTLTVAPTQPLPAGEEALTPPAAGEEALTPPAGGEEGGEAAEDDRGRYPEGESSLSFEWGMLFDAIALALSYTWLCCGVFIVLGVPLFFIVLWVASSARRQRTE